MFKTIETKVIAAAFGGAGGAAVSGFLLWLLGVLIWHAPSDAGHAVAAIDSVPTPVSGLVLLLIAAAAAGIAGYAAPHTTRPDLAATETGLITLQGPSIAASVTGTPATAPDPAPQPADAATQALNAAIPPAA